MKKILLVVCVFVFQFANAQCPPELLILNTQQQVDDLPSLYPDCTEYQYVQIGTSGADPVTNLNGLQNVTSITGWLAIGAGPELTNLDGLDSLTSIGSYCEIYAEYLTDISALSNLESIGGYFKATNSHITSLAALNNLTFLGGFEFEDYNDALVDFDLVLNVSEIEGNVIIWTNGTHVNGLETLTHVGGMFTLAGDNITDLSGIQNLTAIGGLFQLASNCQNLPLQNLISVGGNFQITMPSTVMSLETLSNLTSIGQHLMIFGGGFENLYGLEGITTLPGFLEIRECSGLLSLAGLENLESCNGALYIVDNPLLFDISAIAQLEVLDYYSQYQIWNNPNLEVCSYPSVCTVLEAGYGPGVVVVEDNAPGCATEEEILAGCGMQNNTLSGTVVLNYQDTGCGDAGFGMSNVAITATDSNGEEITTYTNVAGGYHFYLPQGSYLVNATMPEGFTAAPASATIVFDGLGGASVSDFCVSTMEDIDNVKVTIYPVNEARPGFDAVYTIVCENLGSTVASGSVVFGYPESKVDILLSEPAAATASEGELEWDFDALNPFQSITYTVTLNILPPLQNNNGDVLTYTATADSGGDDMPEDDSYVLEQVLVGSYDPNDKTVMEGEEVVIGNADDYLTYRIRFQNTGEVSAIFIRLEDQLDENLDWDTFVPISASHDHRVERIDGMLKVYFDDIFLPAQIVDDPGSNGFFMYKIKPKAGMEIGDAISNTAEIYFDYNLPIITNTVTTEFVTPAGIGENNLSKLVIYPNPAQSAVYFRADSAIVRVVLYNSLGQQVASLKSAESISQMDVSHLASGLYMCHATAADGTISVQKLVISK